MARLFTSGFEINTTTSNAEWSIAGSSSSRSTVNARSGQRALKTGTITSGNHSGAGTVFKDSATPVSFYRVYYYFTSFPGVESAILMINDDLGNWTSPLVWVMVDSGGVLRLYDEDGQISGTTTLSLITYHCLEVKMDLSGGGSTDIVEARVDYGTPFATSSTRNIATNPTFIYVGLNCLSSELNTSGEVYVDDVAVNDNTGSYQNSYPGEGSVILVPPGGAGSSNQWAVGAARTAGSSTNYQKVDENPPGSSSTDYICSTTLNDLDLYSIAPISDISSVDSINVIQMNCNWENDVATTGLAVQLQFVTQGTATSPSSYVINWTSSRTNFINGSTYPIPRFSVYTDYNGNPITKSVLESAEFGVKITSDSSANYIQIQSMWLTVEYVPTLTSFSLGSMMSYYPGF